VSNGAPDHLRPILNQTYMMLLERYGMTSAILDAFDDDMKAFAAPGGKQELKKIVYRVMDGDDVDLGSLTKEQLNYAKTTKVLMGNILYSDSWLEL
jgi:5-methyltetrahydrofolate corrinoid/iron sulfur protein methyltransferase